MSGRPHENWYDSRCEDLAEHFLAGDVLDTPENREILAVDIQKAVEDWFAATRTAEERRNEALATIAKTVGAA